MKPILITLSAFALIWTAAPSQAVAGSDTKKTKQTTHTGTVDTGHSSLRRACIAR